MEGEIREKEIGNDDDMRGVFDGRATESAKSVSERTIDVVPESLETGGVVFQPVVTVAKAMQNRPPLEMFMAADCSPDR